MTAEDRASLRESFLSGAQNSQAVVGLQMAFAYIGSTLVPPLFGQSASLTTMSLYPYFLALCTLIMFISTERAGQRR